MISEIVSFAKDLGVRHRFVFLDDYDIAVARTLYQGADVWLNTPRRPQEACGTSGMKAALNGTLNCSILDGWWDELYDGDNGWAITQRRGPRRPRGPRPARGRQPLRPARAPDRAAVPRSTGHEGTSGVPHGWLRRVKANLVSLGPAVVASRMVRDYVDRALRAHRRERADALRGDELRPGQGARGVEAAALASSGAA